jgi:hypothetical protein
MSPPAASATSRKISDEQLTGLAQQFAGALRDHEFSPAELLGYLLSNRERPIAAAEMGAWVARQRAERQEKEDLKAERKERTRFVASSSTRRSRARRRRRLHLHFHLRIGRHRHRRRRRRRRAVVVMRMRQLSRPLRPY